MDVGPFATCVVFPSLFTISLDLFSIPARVWELLGSFQESHHR